ncbi:MAG: pyridoxamine 5'-phosphate oxidase family protein [Bacillota bacterium]
MVEMSHGEVERMLTDTAIGRLAMASPDGHPYAIPLPFCWADGSLYLRLSLTGRKGTILAHNDRVCFEIDNCSPTLDDYASVLIEGRLVLVIDLGEKAYVKTMNDTKYERLRSGYRPGHGRSISLQQLPLRKIVVEQLSGRKKESTPLAETLTGGR